MGSTVFPDSILKIYLTASPEVRAGRRYKQLKEKGFDANLDRLLDEIRERDARDAGREASPLKPAEDEVSRLFDLVVNHYKYVLVDLEGYRQGAMNEALKL